ncbi:DUF6252 family protein [Hymenobacter sp. J193]|uniref:DUF6252 family protein n=1 Tax=Hymenobacter sp. J193 TaxID=2898429 RepID=UPI002150EBBE|nr:DUF6252 family protein [Hymenobacter sp. J193]MCR5890347.1 DUF6252 family protein [Hymenobacter sp. J193]
MPATARQSRFLLPVLVATLLVGCGKEYFPEPQLPAATQTGAQTAGCKVNGTNWVPVNVDLFTSPPIVAHYNGDSQNHQFTLSLSYSSADKDSPLYDTSVHLSVLDVRAPGSYVLDQVARPELANTAPSYASFIYEAPSPSTPLFTGPQHLGQIVITRLDTVAHVIAGTFEFTAQERNGSATVQVTEGRFDVKYTE